MLALLSCTQHSRVYRRCLAEVKLAMASKKVLVLNAGSSSLKFKLFDNAKNQLVASVSGLIERIGDTSNSQVSWFACLSHLLFTRHHSTRLFRPRDQRTTC